jgi:tRNA threonylcarbamoyladenosine modification (KEOPS) complex  Pcc1 subunit
MPLDRTGLMIIRSWIEQGSSKPLRARLSLTRDIGAGFESEVTLADVSAIAAAVETWLRDVILDGEAP